MRTKIPFGNIALRLLGEVLAQGYKTPNQFPVSFRKNFGQELLGTNKSCLRAIACSVHKLLALRERVSLGTHSTVFTSLFPPSLRLSGDTAPTKLLWAPRLWTLNPCSPPSSPSDAKAACFLAAAGLLRHGLLCVSHVEGESGQIP